MPKYLHMSEKSRTFASEKKKRSGEQGAGSREQENTLQTGIHLIAQQTSCPLPLNTKTKTINHEDTQFQRNHRHLVRHHRGLHQHHGALDAPTGHHRRNGAHPHRPAPALHRHLGWRGRGTHEALSDEKGHEGRSGTPRLTSR